MRLLVVIAGAAGALGGCGSGDPAPDGKLEASQATENGAAAELPHSALPKAVETVAKPDADAPDVGACRMQDGAVLPANALKAIGTEPFWGARIDGRCVAYSHPDDQEGMRIWTQFVGSRDSGVWTGFYHGQRFVLRTRPAPGCSDGMSARRYPVAVTLNVAGEERSGCAFPI